MAAALSTISIGIILWSLWTRRHTWRMKWETAATVNVALIAAAGILGAPPPSPGTPIGQWLHHLTGVWNLQFYLSDLCALAALCAIVYNAVAKLDHPCQRHPDMPFKTWFRKWIQIPTALGTLLLTALFTGSRASRTPYPDLAEMPSPGPYMQAYWVCFSLLLGYLLFHGIRAYIDLWYDPPSRPVMNLYLAASGFAAITLTIRICTALIPALDSPTDLATMEISGSVAASLFCIAAAYSWMRRVRWFSSRPGWGGLTTPRFQPQKARHRIRGGEKKEKA